MSFGFFDTDTERAKVHGMLVPARYTHAAVLLGDTSSISMVVSHTTLPILPLQPPPRTIRRSAHFKKTQGGLRVEYVDEQLSKII